MFAVDCDGPRAHHHRGPGRGIRWQEGCSGLSSSCGAVQCGFCTPGMVVQAKNLLEAHPQASRAEIQRGIEGNLCRCTGYVKIVDAIEAAAKEAR